MSSFNVLLVLRASETYLAPSALSQLCSRLQTRVESKCYWLLTVKGEDALAIAEFGLQGC